MTPRLFAPALRPYAKYLKAAASLLGGLVVGLALTALSLDSGYGFGPLKVGPWTAWPRVGGPGADPYARAVLARSGEAPLGREQGLAFLAGVDSEGEVLEGRCEYRIIDPPPPARFWTIGLARPSGALIENPTGRYVYTSSDVLRREGGGFDIAVAREARAGNWLSPGAARGFVVVLRLYEPIGDIETRMDATLYPKILRLGCA